jgi:hypothetical protein
LKTKDFESRNTTRKNKMTTPSTEQEQRAKWDLLLLDIETRTEQLRQLKTYEGWRLAIQATSAAAAVFIAGAAVGGLLTHAFWHS